ncbi:MAG: hypothetical protein QOG42_1433 [Solirubrobacteraceae bacterium]|jgi:hypothetical protein|nr:hypothetical protein [Solirubrobacteraceae bacterium]
MSTTVRSLALALVLGAVLAPAAQADHSQMSIMMDDDLLVYRNDSTTARTLTQMKTLGVDTVRVTVLWKVVAESAYATKGELSALKGRAKERARKQRKRFKATDPATYPTQNWDRYDNLVKAAQDRGIRVYFNVTGPAPIWAAKTPPKQYRSLLGTWKPNAKEFKKFVMAVGKRFSGTYRDENATRGVLPRVSMWSLWNEPNQAGWLSPQWENGRPASPALYRTLYQQGYAGLVSTGHRADNDIVLLGETAPLGSDERTAKSPMRPKQFIRELFSGDLGAGLPATGYAHHPYTKNVPPTQRDPNPDALTMANISELGDLLDQMAASTGKVVSGLPLFMTEYGFETNPPDPFSGIPLDLQAKFNTLGEYMAYLNLRIRSQAQFLLVDVPPIRSKPKTSKSYWFTYQSGLYTQRGQPKPAAYAYSFPFIVTATGVDPATAAPTVHLWGQLRFLATGQADAVQLQWKPKDGSSDWITVGDPVPTDPIRGYFEADRIAPAPVPGDWRAIWLLPDGSVGLFTAGSDGAS